MWLSVDVLNVTFSSYVFLENSENEFYWLERMVNGGNSKTRIATNCKLFKFSSLF